MVSHYSHAPIYVLDQDSAKAFYTLKVGLETRFDVVSEGVRWLTVGVPGQPDVELVLLEASPPLFDEESAAAMRLLIAKGVLTGGIIATDDCQRSYEAMVARGVVFLQAPAIRPFSIEAIFRDDSGNWLRLAEARRNEIDAELGRSR